MINITVNKQHQTFHLSNDEISYIMIVLPDGSLGHLYYGAKLHEHEDWSHLSQETYRSMSSYPLKERPYYSLEHVLQEYPAALLTDYREPAFLAQNELGDSAIHLHYVGYEIKEGKPALAGLPFARCEAGEGQTLIIYLQDEVSHLRAELSYTLYDHRRVMTRSVRFVNGGENAIQLEKVMSMSLDFPDHDYQWMQFSGAWARERHVVTKELEPGMTSICSLRGHSSHQHNPFVILKRPDTNERQGEAYAFSFVYSGNFLAQCEVDNHGTMRMMMGIHPERFSWLLEAGESFQAPEVIMAYTNQGLNALSGQLHDLMRERLMRDPWGKRDRPILLNSWEACYFDVTEEKVLAMAKAASECGGELFVIDDGWFVNRHDDHAGLGDWVIDREKFPHGFGYLTEKLAQMGLKTGLWIEPEMVNEDSNLYRSHPDMILHVPQRTPALGRNQYVLDLSRQDVIDYLYERLEDVLSSGNFSYVKWDMNRSISDVYSLSLPAKRQGEVSHRYILGLYALYERLHQRFPEMLFESCASGGGRFDAGMLYYAPQAWTSDDTDAIERLKIQYGTSYGYPISAMGSHVSAVPNHQLHRVTPLSTRADVAYFGTFGYEWDPLQLSAQEKAEMRKQIAFMKTYRQLISQGTFYRLQSPFSHNEASWMVVSRDRKEALVGYYSILCQVNGPYTRVRLTGLDPDERYLVNDEAIYYGDELMHYGLITDHHENGDFTSQIFVLKAL
ncbi:MAG: alpha-galactosidase [Intestinibaculum porci]|uniref:alpha-galactosidase n=1 Tax=Intestinibaculum porci TaxID=2487118 RepID=UPI003EFE0343